MFGGQIPSLRAPVRPGSGQALRRTPVGMTPARDVRGQAWGGRGSEKSKRKVQNCGICRGAGEEVKSLSVKLKLKVQKWGVRRGRMFF